jgi:hypothetical protein
VSLSFSAISATASQASSSSYSITAARALAANELGLVSVLNTKAASPDTPTLSGGGVTWVQIATALIGSTGRVTMFRAQGSAPSGTTLTADFAGANQTGCLIVVDACTGTKVDTANNGAAAITQSVTSNSGASADFTITGAALASALNAQYTAFGKSGNSTGTVQDGGTALGGVGKGSPSFYINTEYEINDNHARETLTSAAIAGILVEVACQQTISIGGSITPTGTLGKKTLKGLAGSITPTGTLTYIKSQTLALAGSITPVGTLAKSIRKSLAGSITPTGTLTTQLIHKMLTALGSVIATLTGRGTSTVTLTPENTDTVTLTPEDEVEG